MLTYDPADGPAGIDDNGPNTPIDPDPAPGRCRSCADRIPPLGPVVCAACRDLGYCSICGQQHRAWQCPYVVQVRLEQEAIAKAKRSALVTAWAEELLARYEREPIWQEAA